LALSDAPRLPDWPALTGARVVRALSADALRQSWIVELSGRLRVLRVDKPAAGVIAPNRSGESAVLQAIAGADIGPELIASDPTRGLQLVEYLPGQPLTDEDLTEQGRIVEVAQLLARLHALDTANRPGLPVLDLPEAAGRYARLVADSESSRDAAFVERHAPELIASTGALALTHNDVHAANLIAGSDGSLRLIDWEYAALGPRGFELAALVEQAGLPSGSQRLLLDAYAGDGYTIECEALLAWCELYRRVDRLWARAVATLQQ
jgi:aminoglycoside phosphotransferase (APT) family kinase protein